MNTARTMMAILLAVAWGGGCGPQAERTQPSAQPSRSPSTKPEQPRIHYRTAEGAWESKPVVADGERVRIHIGPKETPAGTCLLVAGKPPWMTLDDGTPPALVKMEVDGKPFALPTENDRVLDAGSFAVDRVRIALEFRDDANPIDKNVGFDPGQYGTMEAEIDRSELGPPRTAGRLGIELSGLASGNYNVPLTVRDMAPVRNAAAWTLRFCIMGITIGPDRQRVALAGAGAGYVLQPDKSTQIILPGDIPFKLTTNLAGTWYYPRKFTEVRILRETAAAKTVLARAAVQGIEGEAFEGFGELEYELTVRRDTPCLLVTTRAFNRCGKRAKINCNWGWLPAQHYVTPAGRQEWKSAESKKYETIGKIGWLWLAPSGPGKPGLVWVSPLRFGESRFATMLLYSENIQADPGEHVDMRFAIGPAESPEAARTIAEELLKKGLLAP